MIARVSSRGDYFHTEILASVMNDEKFHLRGN